jgi:hypothetical protein
MGERPRGSYEFSIDGRGAVVLDPKNLERLRRLFRDGAIIGEEWGPGDEGDFDNGSWHVFCHLAGGTGAYSLGEGRAWVGITFDAPSGLYRASATWREDGRIRTSPLASVDVQTRLATGKCLGFIEGTSLGHVSARGMNDDDVIFNKWKRQQFDQDVNSEEDGGVVWEHWCTSRDIRPTSKIGTSVLEAWLELVNAMGGRFIAAVARGRRDYGHPVQLAAMVKAGLLSEEEALWETTPRPIPKAQQALLYEARPNDALVAVEALPFVANEQRYFMFERRIGHWSKSEDVKKDLG